jgi:hypothetical protein
VQINRRFDLAVSLEVAEHLESGFAKGFVRSLVKLSSLVLFSAAIPYQGSPFHVNEQWPDYWAALFAEHGYVVIDCIRPTIWNNDQVEWWYAQNTLLFAEKDQLSRNADLRREWESTKPSQLCLVHPKKFLIAATRPPPPPPPIGLRQIVRMLPALLIQAVRRRLKRSK